MRLLLMHVDYIEYKTTKATKYAEDLEGLGNEARMEEALAVFIAAERADAVNVQDVALEASKAIQDVATKVAT
jgi:hypothetical protein